MLGDKPASGTVVANEIFGRYTFDLIGTDLLDRFRQVHVVHPITHGDCLVDLTSNGIRSIAPVYGTRLDDRFCTCQFVLGDAAIDERVDLIENDRFGVFVGRVRS